MFVFRFIAAALMLASVPAAWAQDDAGHKLGAPSKTDGVNATLSDYGKWLAAVQGKQARLGIIMAQVRGAWQSAVVQPDRAVAARQFRAAAAQFASRIDAVSADVMAIPLPAASGLAIDKDIQPVELRTALIDINSQLRQVIVQSTSVLDGAAKGDYQAAKRGSDQMVKGMGSVIRSQLLMARANLETQDPQSSVYAVMAFDVTYLKTIGRLLDAIPSAYAAPSINRPLATELDTLATTADATADRGAVLLEKDIQTLGGGSGPLAGKILRLYTSMRDNFALAHRFATSVREAAASIRTKPMNNALLEATMGKLRPIKEEMDRLENVQAGILAE